MGNDCIDFQCDKLCRHFLQSRGIALSPAVFNVNISVFHITELAQLCADRIDFLDVAGSRRSAEKSDTPDFTLLLGEGRQGGSERPCADGGEKLTAMRHSITLSARTRMDCGNGNPTRFKAPALTVSSCSVTSSIG